MAKGNIYDAAYRHLANRSRSVKEMRQYLCKKEYEQEEIDQLVDEFLQCGYLNDFDFALQYCRYAAGKGKGKRRIFAELAEKGVARDTAEMAFDEFSDSDEGYSEEAAARQVAEKILRLAGIDEGEAVPDKVRARIARNLAQKGFSSELIYRIISR